MLPPTLFQSRLCLNARQFNMRIAAAHFLVSAVCFFAALFYGQTKAPLQAGRNFYKKLVCPKNSQSCLLPLPCTKEHEELNQAVRRGDRDGVCRLLPLSMQCMQNTLDACTRQNNEAGLPEFQGIPDLPQELELWKRKYRETCPDHYYDWTQAGNLASRLRLCTAYFVVTVISVIHQALQ